MLSPGGGAGRVKRSPPRDDCGPDRETSTRYLADTKTVYPRTDVRQCAGRTINVQKFQLSNGLRDTIALSYLPPESAPRLRRLAREGGSSDRRAFPGTLDRGSAVPAAYGADR